MVMDSKNYVIITLMLMLEYKYHHNFILLYKFFCLGIKGKFWRIKVVIEDSTQL